MGPADADADVDDAAATDTSGTDAAAALVAPGAAVIGLGHGVVRLDTWSPVWTAAYAELAARLAQDAGALVSAIEHVGSTAVPGLTAKPIIDIALGFEPGRGPALVDALQATAWMFRGDKGEAGLLFVRESEPQVRIAHVHAVQFGGAHWCNYLAFRDLLRRDRLACKRYEDLKAGLAVRFPHDRAAYTAGKQALVRQFLGCQHSR